ncbi:hypothetical protein HYE54_00995 [Aggregatibacter actinomycetemcomitans]|uniref:ADP-ribosyltransferase-containing protein n=1 Tax=Aggregatibacter actinomycetemcomitans TaxID=714 RepID=UPI00197B3F99|nr:LPD38 domain-containing protein [Aggregatibacter actinomycetemcomitans]MBN6067395.1 hypothetical protein [Aggregatibacter actinomycetemcomitans]MBN6086103.1 hypothetical protein [Aggregatibacter actinomycetemcomitans]
MSFYLSDKDYNNIIGIISGNPGGGNKKGNDNGGTYIDMPTASAEPKQQGILADTVDAVQMGAWKGLSDIAHGVGALTGAEWLHKVGDWAAEGADENLATMSDEMKAALNQNAFDGEGQGVRNVRWWAGNLGSLIGQNLDTVITLGAGKAATFGVKQAGKLLLKKEAAEEVGKAAVEQAAKRGIPKKYWNMVGITATMSAMSGGSRYGQKRDEVLAMTNDQLAQIPQFSDAYYSIADSEEGKDKSVEEIYSMAKSRFADKVGRDAALNPTAIATDLATNAVSGLGGGFWGLGSPAKTIKGGLLKGAMVEGGTEAIQGIGEQYALNKAEQDNYNPNKDLTEGMWDNAVNGIVLGGAFGSAMGVLDTYTDRRAFNNQKRTLLNHINTGNEAIDSQLKNYVDMLNQGATDLSDLVSASRVQALNNAGIANARARQAEEGARAQQQANAQFESDFFGEEQTAQSNQPEFKVDPQMERAVHVAKALEKFRKGDLSGANEFIGEPMVFSDNQAKSQFVIGRSFDELKNIAQSYGLDPRDGKSMRQWIEDYIAKAREFNENNQQPAPENNLQFTANIAPENRSGVVSGTNDEIDVGNGNYQPFQYEVVDSTALSPTQQKDDNQFRDRDRTASQSQINNIARNLDPRKLASSPTMDMGAPLLALDGKTIIAGNGRTMAIRQAYQEGGAEGYRQFLKDNAGRFGIDSAQLGSLENPVLVRRLTSPVDIAQVAINSNEQGGMRMSDLEQAQTQGNLSQASMFGDVAFDKLGSLQQAKNVDEDIRLSLNESANSDFAKAVDTVIQGGKPSKKYIPMGTTPSALVMLGVQNTKVLINRDVLNKVMSGKHYVSPEALKQLPRQINNPVAVMKSAPRATQQGYVVLTELIEVNTVNGAKEPVISALHLRTAKDGIEVINIASVYGKNLSGLQNMLNHDLLYWNKQKGSQLINAFGLQLPAKIASNSVSLNGYSNIKTEADLSQYLSAKNNQESSANQEIQRAQAIINKTFGKAAQHIEVTTFANPPKDVKNLITSDVEGWFNPKTGKITIVADSIKPTKTMTKDERLQFVAWHEMAHRGINVGYKGTYDNLMAEVGKNKAVNQIADAIQTQRKGTDDLAATNRTVAIEEAIAEIMAANETGKWNELESRYGVEIKKGQRQSAKSWLAMTAQRIKEFLSKIFGVERASQFSDEDVLNLVANIKKSAVGNLNEGDGVRFSRTQELTEENYNQAKAKGETELTFHQWKQVRSPEFKAWFGDWENDPKNASKVVNERTGEPLVVYHGTDADFNIFDVEYLGGETYSNANNTENAMSAGIGHWFSSRNLHQEEGYGSRNISAFLNIREPNELSNLYSLFDRLTEYVPVDEDGDLMNSPHSFDNYEDITQYAQEYTEWNKDRGFDGIIIKKDNEYGGTSYVAFDSNQIKSATDNNGDFSSENDDIRFSRKSSNYRFNKSDIEVNGDHKIGASISIYTGETLGDVLERSPLFDSYPELASIKVERADFDSGTIYDKQNNVFKAGNFTNAEAFKSYVAGVLKDKIKGIPKAEVSDVNLSMERYKQDKSDGVTSLNYKQYVQTRSKEFKKFFGDWEAGNSASKVVDENTGEPLVLYHGTGAKFNVFDPNKMGRNGLQYGTGFYFTDSKSLATGYKQDGGEVQQVYLNIRKWLNRERITITDSKLRDIINEIDKINGDITEDGLLSNFNDVRLVGKSRAMNEAISSMKGLNNDVDLVDELSSLSNNEAAAQAITNILGPVGSVATLPDGDKVYTVLTSNQIKSATRNQGSFDKTNPDIRFSRANTMQSALELSQSAFAENEPSIWDNLKAKDFSGFKERFNRVVGKVDEMFADSLRPVNDWIDSMHLADQTGNTSSRDHEKRRLKDAMYTAKGKRDAFNSELEQAYLKPILSKIAALSKATKKGKNPIDELTMKRMVGNWISARYSIEKNMDLLRADEKAMRDTKRLLDSAKQNGSMAEINRLSNAYAKAKERYENRKADIYNTDYKNKGSRFKVGVAGGWSIPEAELIMKNTEQRIGRSDLESVANMVYDLNQARLEIDRASGRYTEQEYQDYKANRHYVPLTGDPNADVDTDIISGAGASAVNIGRDKALKGRTNSEAEDAIDAVWKSVGKTTTYAGFAEFKGKIDDLYETEVTMLKEKGYSDSQAREQATANLGISKRKMQGLTRSSDNVLIRKEGGQYYEYELPTQTMEALRNDNVEHANAFLKVISKPTGWYARGVTQWMLTFAPMNMARDTWEKSEFIRVQKLYDKNNRLVDSKTMDKIGRDTLKNAFTDKEVWQATKRLGFGQELRDSVPAERMLKQLLKEGGVSNYGTYLDKSETDLIKRLKKENNPIAGKLEKVGKVLEGYNKMFDTVSALAAYKALVENGIDSKQAAATTLELTNFRKTGSKMRGVKALYMFSQPTVMGAANLIRYLSTRKGQVRFAAYMAGMTALYTVLRSMDDDDEGGNKMDQLGDITRYIPIPIGGGHYFKIPVGFGMPQMAWNFSTNIVKGAVSDISLTEAGANMLVHSLKTFSPVSPSEISAAKYPMEKLTLTATPTILQPLMQNVLNRSAFGNKITTNFVRDDKLKAEQSKATTAQFWKDVALDLNDTLGIDMHPEQIKNLFDGYSSVFGSLKELNTVFVENPNREQLGRNTRMPFINQFIGTTNEFSIQSRYYEASEEARKVATEYESRKNRGVLDGWLDDDKRKLIKFYEQDKSVTQKMRSEKSKLTRALRSGQISAVAYENGIKRYNKDMSRTQAQILRKYRLIEGLNTN